MKVTKKMSLLGIAALVLVVVIYFLLSAVLKKPQWKLHLYSHADGGLTHEMYGTFPSHIDCENEATARLKGGRKIHSQGDGGLVILDGFLCGLNCVIDAPFGSVFINEMKCEKSSSDPSFPK